MIKKKHILKVIILLSVFMSSAQDGNLKSITLKEAYEFAQQNYPLIKDAVLIDAIEKVNLEVIKKSGLPKISMNGVAQLQSESIELNLGSTAIEGPLETYNAYLSADYDLYDGGKKRAESDIQRATSLVDRNAFKVQMRATKDRVNVLLFAISLSRKQKSIIDTSIDDLQSNIRTLEAGYINGSVLESEVSKLKVRKLELVSDLIKLQGDINAYIAMLEQLTGKTLSDAIVFEIPVLPADFISDDIDRPEQELFNSQKSLFAAQEASIAASLKPKVSLFAQGGIGNPNPLNFSDFNDSPYALGGLKLSWNFFDFGKSKKQKELLKVQQQQIEVDKEIFLFDVQSEAKDYIKKMEALKAQIVNDEAIVVLQKDILRQSKVQLDNGVINSSEYVTQINATLSAEQNLEFNRIKLQQYSIEYLTLIGKL